MIYLDNNATTPLAPEVLEEMQRVAVIGFGNPGSRHVAGRKARQILEDSRETIANLLDADPREVIFTSGGTEASNLAIFGLTAGRTGCIAVPPGEHPATVEPIQRLVQRGCRRSILKLNTVGQIESNAQSEISWTECILATALVAHNETGTILELEELISNCKEHHVPLHLDAVQAAGKIPVSFRHSGAATMSIGAHKFHGPRGIGALLIKEGVKVFPRIVGGFQEHGKRAGTESVMLAAGLARALSMCHENLAERADYLRNLRDRLEAGLITNCAPTAINGDYERRLPNTLNIAFPGCDADALLVALDLCGICCSHGSACASGSAEPAPILLGMNCPPEIYKSSLRFSVGVQNNQSEIDEAVRLVGTTVARLRNL